MPRSGQSRCLSNLKGAAAPGSPWPLLEGPPVPFTLESFSFSSTLILPPSLSAGPSSLLPLLLSSLSLAQHLPSVYLSLLTCSSLDAFDPLYSSFDSSLPLCAAFESCLLSSSPFLPSSLLPTLSQPPSPPLPFLSPSTPAPHPSWPTWGVSDDRWATPPRGPCRGRT